MEKKSLYIYKLDEQGNKVKFPNSDMPAKLGEYTYSAQRMAGTPTLTATLNYPSCLDDLWSGDEFVEFRGEKYYVDQIPTSSKDNKSIMYKHELQFVSERIVLENVYFMDVVTTGADTYHSNSTSVKFMGDINEFVGRLNASMTKSGIGYSIVIDDGITSDSKLVTLDHVYIADALQSIYTIYELPYYFVGKVCHIGYTENVISTPFEYRKGLVSIKKTNANYKIVNRVTGVGSSDNIPFYYPNDSETGTIERSQNLMPSIYRQTSGAERFYNALNNTYKIPGTNDYYSFQNIYSAKKVKEIKVDFSDIKPTIEGVTNASGQLFGEIADIAFDANDSDELGTGTGNNVFNGTDEYVHSYFYIKLHIYNGDYGFNLFEQGLEGGTAVINMTTGNCAACEFEIGVTYKEGETRAYNPVLVDSNGDLPAGDFEQKVTYDTSQYVTRQQNTSTNEVWIAVKKDNTSFGVVMPNATNNYKPSIGDKFVITGIKMPKPLVLAAEKRLEDTLIKYMSENNDEKFMFSVNFSRVFLANNSDLADILNENARIYIKYNNREYLMYVNSFTCKADKNCLYDISVELTDKLSANVSALRSTITEIAGDIIGNKIGSGSGNVIDFPANKYGMFLRRDIDDTALGKILFEKKIGSSIFTEGWNGKGWEIQASGSAILNDLRVKSDLLVGNVAGSPTFASGFTGWGWQIDTPTATGEMDNLFIRKTFTAYEIVYSQIYGLGGSQIVSDINKIARVENLGDRYRCYMDDMDGLMLMNLRKGDGVRIQTRTGTTSIKYLFGRCLGVDSYYFDIAIPLLEGGGEPQAGDFALRWGNNEDTDRQGLIYLTTADSGAPFIDVYDGITESSTEGKLKARLGHLTGIRTQRGDLLSGYGAYLNGIYVENSTYIMQDGKTIEQTFTAMNGKFESVIGSIRNDISSYEGNILVNSSFSQDTNYWTVANNVHFINVGGSYLWVDGSFYVEKSQVADIYNDNGQNVLRMRNTYIFQQNAVMKVPEHEEGEEKTYSFSLFYKVLRAGSCGFGIPGTALYHEEQLSESDSYKKFSKVEKWDGTGNFELRFTGDILIYGVGLYPDEMADAVLKLQTQISQTDEYIKLLATKEYVDSESGKIYLKYDGALEVTAEQISAINTKTDNINHTIETAGWITRAEGVTLFAKKEMENGEAIVNAINVGTGGILIQANRINMVGAVTFSMLNSSLQNTINNKVDPSDLGDLAYADYITKGMMSTALQSELNGKVNASALGSLAYASSVSKNNLASSLLTEFNGKADSVDLKALAYLDRVEKAQLGSTIISGGHIITSLIDTDAIYANMASIGGFTIENNGIFSNNKYSGESSSKFFLYSSGDSAFLGFSASGKWAGIGLNTLPSVLGGTSALMRLEYTTSHSDINYGAIIDVRNGTKNYALYCTGALKVNGPVSLTRYLRPDLNSSDVIQINIGYMDTFVFQPSAYRNVFLPSRSTIESKVGAVHPEYGESWTTVGFNSVIFIHIIVTRYASNKIHILAENSNTPLVDNDGNVLSGLDMDKGDCATFAYYNTNWYIFQLQRST